MRCGKPGHYASVCLTNPLTKEAKPRQIRETAQAQPTTLQHSLRQNFKEYKRQQAHVQPVETTSGHQPSDDSDSSYQTDEEDPEPKT